MINKNYTPLAYLLRHHEKILIATFVLVYLYIFQTVIPSGDALVYVGHIEREEFVWNPNHLFMDVFGHSVYKLLGMLHVTISPLTLFKWFSAIATVTTLLITHQILLLLKINDRTLRLVCILAIFGSKNFISMAVSEEFFMVQMPFLMLIVYFTIKIITMLDMNARISKIELIYIGLSIAVCILISIHNIILFGLLSLYLFLIINKQYSQAISSLSLLWVVTFLAIAPLFLIGYYQSEHPANFFNWLVAYKGVEDNPSATLYGFKLSTNVIITSIGRLFYNSFVNFFDAAGVGTIVKSMIFSQPIEFSVNKTQLILSILLIFCFVISIYYFVLWLLKNLKTNPFTQFIIAWFISYLIFNFYWNDSSDQFWFQVIPLFWLVMFSLINIPQTSLVGYSPVKNLKLFKFFIMGLSIILFIFNTLFFVTPRAFADIDFYMQQHHSMIRKNDLEIVPGWDDYNWMSSSDIYPAFTRLTLMNLALTKNENGKQKIEALSNIIQAHLENNQRVIIARLYDLDSTPRPWSQLRKLGWDRKKIMQQLDSFEAIKIKTIDGVTYRELRLKR